MKQQNKYLNLLMTSLAALAIGAVMMMVLGHDPVEAYIQLFRGAFIGKLNFGTTLQKFLPLLLTAMAFAVAARAGVFNVGVEGEMYLGAIAAAWIGYTFTDLPGIAIILIALLFGALVGAAWAAIPGALKAYLGVNEVCSTILLNYVAIYITSYLVNGPFSARTGVPQTPTVAASAKLTQFLKPSQAHMGLFIGIALTVFVIWLLSRSTIGYQFTSIGFNPKHAEYVGIDPRKGMLYAMLLSGLIGGVTGGLEVLGTYGYFLGGFSAGIAFDGMLASLIVKNDIRMVPFMAFFLATLKSGALGMERYTGVPKSIVDMIIAIFIIFATMETLFAFLQNRRKRPSRNVETES